MPVKKISTSEVEVGMVVSDLDRPWSETNFPLQGFQVKSATEIEELKKQARYVYIMVPDEELEISGLSHHPSMRREISPPTNQKRHVYTRTFEEEIVSARKTHAEVSSMMYEVLDGASSGHELPLERITSSVSLMVKSISNNPDAYIWLTRMKTFDSYVYRDSLNASVLATTFGVEVGLSETKLEDLGIAAMFMDIGKMQLPGELLHKNSRLTHDEWDIMKTHVLKSCEMLEKTPDISGRVLETVKAHHERLNGSGYPYGLVDKQIPLLGQMAGIVDFYVSITSPRPYAEHNSPSAAINMLYQQKDRYFDEALVGHFIQAISTFPTGSLVELSTGQVGLVVSQNQGHRLKPNVMLLLNENKQPYKEYKMIDLLDYTYTHTDNPISIASTLPEGSYNLNVENVVL